MGQLVVCDSTRFLILRKLQQKYFIAITALTQNGLRNIKRQFSILLAKKRRIFSLFSLGMTVIHHKIYIAYFNTLLGF